jgi:hypothetical protein
MKEMMLWFDGTSSPLADKITRAVVYYEKKYNRRPSLCYVHTSAYVEGLVVAGVRIEASAKLLTNDLWLGEAEPFMERAAAMVEA